MPRKAKDENELNIKSSSTVKKAKKAETKKETVKKEKEPKTTKKASTTKTTAAKKETKTTKKTVTKKATSKASKTPVVKEEKTKEEPVKKTTSSKTTKKIAEKKVTKAKEVKTTKTKLSTKKSKVNVVEYYDLPTSYNKTTVKILAQTPNTLFVYWDISEEDKNNYIKQYGNFFFNDTKPVLVIHNITKNYTYEIDINDFANSWYLEVKDGDCEYEVTLARRPINEYAKIDNYMEITSSNNIDAPNDHILFDSLSNNVSFKNVKTNTVSEKNISLSFLTKLGKLYNVKEFYRTMYKDESIDFDKLNLKNMPSS